MTEPHVHDQLPAYALGCLDPDEIADVETHLSTCADCLEAVRDYERLCADLAQATPQVTPPPRVKARLSEATEPHGRRFPGWWPQRLSLAWTLTTLLVVIIGAGLWLSRASQSENLQTIALRGTEDAPQATGLIVLSLDGEHGTLVVDKMPLLRRDQTYQLWLIDAQGGRDSGALFQVSEDGYGSVWVASPRALDSYASYGVTIEPQGGSPAPTGARMLQPAP